MEPVGAVEGFDLTQIGEPAAIHTRPVVSEQMVYVDLRDERVQDTIGRITNAVREEYPDAEFVSYIGTSPLGVYTEVYTTENDFGKIIEIVDSKLNDLRVAAGVDIVLVPKRKVAALAA